MDHIFVSTGTQLPFDRLVFGIDEWAYGKKDLSIYAQVGEVNNAPQNMEYCHFLSLDKYRKRVLEADILVSHAGIGSIMSAIEFKKPLVILPRSQRLKEHRSDHQEATARRFMSRQGIYVAWDTVDLRFFLDSRSQLMRPNSSENNTHGLKKFIKSYIDEVVC